MIKQRKWMALLLAIAMSLSLVTGCDSVDETTSAGSEYISSATEDGGASEEATEVAKEAINNEDTVAITDIADVFVPEQVPAYTGAAFTVVHDNIPYFVKSDLSTTSYENYAPLDNLGRCGVAVACVGKDLMPTEKRGSIGQVKPSGWQTVKYDNVDGKYLYNRCHLIGYQLSGENANKSNLITGTRYLNMEGMLPFENMVADYVKETDNHVLYRVTPVFVGNDLVANGVLMEAYSVEDNGEGICYCVYAYNVQPGIGIDYATGESWLDNGAAVVDEGTTAESPSVDNAADTETHDYVLNDNSKKFHTPDCRSVKSMKNPRYITATRDEVCNSGYEPCKTCCP